MVGVCGRGAPPHPPGNSACAAGPAPVGEAQSRVLLPQMMNILSHLRNPDGSQVYWSTDLSCKLDLCIYFFRKLPFSPWTCEPLRGVLPCFTGRSLSSSASEEGQCHSTQVPRVNQESPLSQVHGVSSAVDRASQPLVSAWPGFTLGWWLKSQDQHS